MIRSRIAGWTIAALLAGMAETALGVDLLALGVSEQDGSYHAALDARLDAPPAQVWRVLTDFSRFREITPSIRSSEVLGRAGPRAWRVKTNSAACVWVLCKEMTQVQRVETVDPMTLLAVVDPAASDFARGEARWHVSSVPPGRSRLEFSADLKPAFWVPPWLGSWLIRQALTAEMQVSAANLERLAQGSAP